jgi:hypothetical protein
VVDRQVVYRQKLQGISIRRSNTSTLRNGFDLTLCSRTTSSSTLRLLNDRQPVTQFPPRRGGPLLHHIGRPDGSRWIFNHRDIIWIDLMDRNNSMRKNNVSSSKVLSTYFPTIRPEFRRSSVPSVESTFPKPKLMGSGSDDDDGVSKYSAHP